MTSWSPNSYLRFEDARTRPAADLAARIDVEAPAKVIDLGCGPGNSTQVLRARWPLAQVTGLDGSPEMIAAARKSFPDHVWTQGAIEEWQTAEPVDVIFSNAALQWIGDHASLLARLFSQVAPGGALAFQIPSANYSPVRWFIREISRDEAWTSRMDGARATLTMEEPSFYYDVLAPLAESVDVWETEYSHVMESPDAIIDWISSTGLRPYLGALASDAERRHFVALLSKRVAESFPRRADGRVLFPFRRTFVVAYAAATTAGPITASS